LHETLTLLQTIPSTVGGRSTSSAILLWRKRAALLDGDKFKQVFWNLSENALRAMPNGGTLRVSLHEMKDGWVIGFADTGIGLNPQDAEKIFEPFQSHFEGGNRIRTGHRLPDRAGTRAQISVHSSPQNGAEFVLEIPKATVHSPKPIAIDARSSRGAASGELGRSKVAHG